MQIIASGRGQKSRYVQHEVKPGAVSIVFYIFTEQERIFMMRFLSMV